MKKEIKSLLNNYNVFFTGLGKNGQSTTDNSPRKKYDIILGYNKYYELYVAWNGFLHGEFIYATIASHLIRKHDNISFEYGKYNMKQKWGEKKVLIPKQYINDFCNSCIEYLMPNPQDANFKDSIWIWGDSESEIISSDKSRTDRRRILRKTFERDPSFRERVLENYDYKCAVCRTEIMEILEAAHIDAVADNGNDSLGNGICLCRNHHKLFDSALLHFKNDYTFYSDSEKLLNDELFKLILQKYDGKLLEPKVKSKFVHPDINK